MTPLQRSFLWSCLFIFLMATTSISQINTTRRQIDNNIDGGYWIHVIDFDKDGDADILAASLNSGLKWYENNGSGSFSKQDIDGNFTGAWSVHGNDIDGDGDIDLVACSAEEESGKQNSEVAWYEKDGGSLSKRVIDTNLTNPHSIHSGDFDNDGDIDVVAAIWTDDQIVFYENDGDENFSKNILNNNFGSAHSVYAVDIDGDGDEDILGGGGSEGAFWRNNGGGNFTEISIGNKGTFVVYGADIDGDGDTDILRSQRDTFDVDWFENNNGTGSNLTEHTFEPNWGECWGIVSADLDGDGDEDILGAIFAPNGGIAPDDGVLNYWLNDGNENFTKFVLDNNVRRPRSVGTADFDKDGDLDMAVITRDNDAIFWYEVEGSPPVEDTITLLTPNGGETLEVEQSFEITWETTGDISNVKLEYSTDNGANWTEISASTPDDGSFDWTVPDATSDEALVRAQDAADGDPSDVSDGVFSITQSSITVTSPNGGESWEIGTTQSITWTSSGQVNNVKIEYSTDNGTTWNNIISGTANTGSFDWTVPDEPTNTALIRVQDAADGSPIDVSDDVFAIVETGLTVTFPNGGETLLAGSQVTLTWNTTGTVDFVTLEYSLDNGANWTAIITNVSNTGSLPWTLPEEESDEALIRVFDADDGEPSDTSDAVFAITQTSLTLTAPNGGETWTAGDVQNITWQTVGSIDSVMLEYSTDNGSNWMTIIASVQNTDSFSWTIPDVDTDIALVRLTDVADPNTFDVSDGVFTILGSMLTITAPNGGESWEGGSIQSITWTHSGVIDSVKLEYSLNNGSTWTTITEQQENTGLFDWQVPNIETASGLVRISDADDNTPQDVSDGVFSIFSSSITITTPNGGDIFLAGSTQTIAWATVGDISSVTIDYSVDNGAQWMNIATSVFNAGTFEWTVPVVNSNNALVRVLDASDGVPSDVSDDTFSIVNSTLSITSPNGGETWLGGSAEVITWHSTGFIDSVSLEYTLNGGVNWMTIIPSTINDGLHMWTVPDVGTDSAMVRITDVANASIADTSDGFFTIDMTTDISLDQDSDIIPTAFDLSQNYPNPFNPTTTIRFALPQQGHVDLRVYNYLGELVEVLVSGNMAAGEYNVQWEAANLPSGVYLYTLRAGGFSKTMKLMLVK